MAKKINVKLILELRSAGMGRNAIAASRHISKNSVGDVFHIADRMGISYEDIAQMDADAVYRKFYPDKFALENLYDKPDYEYVHQELKTYWCDAEAPLAGIPGQMQGVWQHSHGIYEILPGLQRIHDCKQAYEPPGT